jgi:hypothetical protein
MEAQRLSGWVGWSGADVLAAVRSLSFRRSGDGSDD